MNRMLKHVVMIILMAGGVISAARAESVTNVSPQAAALMKQAYQNVVEAELAGASHREADARKSYRAALSAFARLKSDYPGWQAGMIDRRQAECQKALAALEKPLEPEVKKEQSAPTGAAASNETVRLQGVLLELRKVQTTLALIKGKGYEEKEKQLEDEVERLEDALNDASKARQELQRKVSKLEARLSKLNGRTGGGSNHAYRAVIVAVKSEANRLMKEGDMLPAIKMLNEAVELIPGESELEILLAVAYCQDGRYAEAIPLLTPYDVWRPKNSAALLTLGMAHMGLGQIGEARDATEKALHIKPDSADGHYNLAQILISILPPDAEGAREHYQRALELGAPVDAELENALKTALIITRMKKRPGLEQRTTSRSVKSEVRTPRVKTDTP